MTTLRVWLARLGGLFHRSSRDRALAEEMRSHLHDLTDDLADRGLSRAEAITAARRAFGGVDQIAEVYRDQRGWPLVDSVLQDVRLAFKLLRTRPGGALLAIVSLALGVGVSMGFFTLVNAFCLRGLPIDRPERVLFVTTQNRDGEKSAVSYAEFQDVRRQVASFAATAAYRTSPVNVADDRDPPERLNGCYISAGAFGLLSTTPVIGREFAPSEDEAGAPLVAIIGHAVWMSRYAGSPAAVGQQIRVNGRPATIVGVMPDGFGFPAQATVWLPLAQAPGVIDQPRSARTVALVGRLTDVTSALRAQDELQLLGDDLEQHYPATNRDIRFAAVPINDQFNSRITQPEWMAFLTAGLLVLLVACANVANVLLGRLGVRAREVALRLAMGATRGRVMRQFLIESLVLATLASALGLVFSIAAVRLLAWTVPSAAPLPYWITFAVDARVLLALLITCTMSVLFFGVVPAFLSSRVNVHALLKEGGRSIGSRRTRRWTATFLAIEFALTFVLLANVSMDVRREFLSANPGIQIDEAPLLTARLALPPERYATDDTRRGFYERLDQTLTMAAGVASATTARELPPQTGEEKHLMLAGQVLGPGEESPTVLTSAVGPRFFTTLDVGMLAGRELVDDDGVRGREGVVVNQQFAETFFAGRSPLGERIQLLGSANAGTAAWRTVVGVAPTFQQGQHPRPAVYVSDREAPQASMVLVIRTALPAESVAAAVRSAVAELDGDLPLYRVVSLDIAHHEGGWNGRVSSGMLLTITMIALVLAVVGLYAVTTHAVAQRTQEIGVRTALGATPAAVSWLVLKRALSYVAFGLAAALPCTYVFERQFLDTTSGHPLLDLVNIGTVAALLLVATIVACLRPAARASRIEPVTALRTE